jgi:hypothetical protein
VGSATSPIPFVKSHSFIGRRQSRRTTAAVVAHSNEHRMPARKWRKKNRDCLLRRSQSPRYPVPSTLPNDTRLEESRGRPLGYRVNISLISPCLLFSFLTLLWMFVCFWDWAAQIGSLSFWCIGSRSPGQRVACPLVRSKGRTGVEQIASE